MKKLFNFIDHIYTATKHGVWNFELVNNHAILSKLMPYDGWNYCLQLSKLRITVWYPWCGNID
jgi:hypothetical protein